MSKKSKFGLNSLVLFGVGAVGMILAIVGMFLDFFKATVSGSAGGFGGTSDASYAKLADVSEDAEMIGVTTTFAWIVFVLAIVSVAALIVVKVLGMKELTKIVALVGAVTVLATILFFIFAIIFCSKNSASAGGSLVSVETKFSVAIGPILMLIGGLFAGGSAAASIKY